MERGLLWLPLLVAFIWLAWSGWNEYQKLEAYKLWAEDFDNAKFDIYAVLAKKERQITWGKPTRQGVQVLKDFSLNDVEKIDLVVKDRAIDPKTELPSKGKPYLQFDFGDRQPTLKVPFTDITLAAKWLNYLQKN